MYPVTTFSIAACDPVNGEWGIAVQSKFLAVGSLVPYVEAKVGAIASQAKTNSRFGIKGAGLLRKGLSAQEALEELIREDENREIRQLGIVDRDGRSAAYTGRLCYPYANHLTGENFSCQGNVLLGQIVLDEMADTFIHSGGDLAQRLVAALEAAQNAGGERRGQESAALLIRKVTDDELLGEAQTYVDLRVDEHVSPILELKRLLGCHRVEYAQNHKDKYYPFEGDTRYRVIGLLIGTGLLKPHLEGGETVERFLTELGEKLRMAPVFDKGFVNGRLIDWIVNRFYGQQEEELV